MSVVSKIGKYGFQQIKHLPKQEIFGLCEELWLSGYLEESVIACLWAEALHKQYEPAYFKIFKHWVQDCLINWTDCETLCNHTVGDFIMMYSKYISELKKWSTSSKRFVRSATAVTLIIPARRDLFLNDIFKIADILLLDKDYLAKKGYGWVIKASCESRQKEVFDYLSSKKSVMPRTAFRNALEKMPAELRTEAMKRKQTTTKKQK